jgi:DNA-binding protein HU-beta
MTKAELISEIALKTGYDKKTIGVIVENFTESVKKNLANGENVFIRGFGSFVTKKRAAKVARNISQSTSIAVPEHSIPSFRPAAEFKAVIRNRK